jgi:hypothetical protein
MNFHETSAGVVSGGLLGPQDGTQDDPGSTQDGSKTIFETFFFHLRFCLRFWSLLGRILAPSWAPFGLQKLSQVGCAPGPVESKTTHGDQDGPRPIQDGPKTPQVPPKSRPRPPKTSKRPPQTPQNEQKSIQDTPKTTKNRPKTRETKDNNTTQHNTTQHNTTQHKTRQDKTRQHNTTQHNTTQHNTTQHNTTPQLRTQHNTQHNTTPGGSLTTRGSWAALGRSWVDPSGS